MPALMARYQSGIPLRRGTTVFYASRLYYLRSGCNGIHGILYAEVPPKGPARIDCKLYPAGGPRTNQSDVPKYLPRTTLGPGSDLAAQLLLCKAKPSPSLEVTPCEAKPKNTGENSARWLWVSMTQIGLSRQSNS